LPNRNSGDKEVKSPKGLKLDRIHEIDSEHDTIFQNDNETPSPINFTGRDRSHTTSKQIESNFLAHSEYAQGQKSQR